MNKHADSHHSRQLIDKKDRITGIFKQVLMKEGLDNETNQGSLEKFINTILKINVEPEKKMDDNSTQTDFADQLLLNQTEIAKVSDAILA